MSDNWQSEAENVARDMGRRALAAALAEPDGRAVRHYHTAAGLIACRATWDGWRAAVAWDVDGTGLGPSQAVVRIAAHMRARLKP